MWHWWAQALPKLEDVTVPRCFMPIENAGSIELHCFSDACETGYGAVCYFRIASGSSWCCQFVTGKSRVAPLKALRIPRLELCAATLATKLAQLVSSQLRPDLERTFFWTDSTSDLQYIANSSRRFRVFVANCVSVIHENSDVSQWCYIDTKNNPADIVSRELLWIIAQRLNFGFKVQRFYKGAKPTGRQGLLFCCHCQSVIL